MNDFRFLEKNDFNKGYVDLLKQLTNVGDITLESFNIQYDYIMTNKYHYIFVLEENKKIIASGTLLIEPKIIHNCGFVGHIEDIVVDKNTRGKQYGQRLINFLTYFAQDLGCYKVILDCSKINKKFYEKCKFSNKGICMAKYFE